MRIAYLLLALSLAAPAHAETTKFNPFTGKPDYIGLSENGDGSRLTGVRKSTVLTDYLPANYVTDGSVNYATQIQAWLNSGGKALHAPAGTWRADSTLTIPTSVELSGDGDSTVFDFRAMPISTDASSIAAPGFVLAGSRSATATTLTATPAVNTTALTVASSSGFAVGDLVLIESTSEPWVPAGSAAVSHKGELAVVDSVSAGAVNLRTRLMYSYTHSATPSPTVTKINAVTAHIHDIKVVMGGAGSGHAGIKTAYTRDPLIERVTLEGAENVGITFLYALNPRVVEPKITGWKDPSFTTTGYGILFSSAVRGGGVSGGSIRYCRHAVSGGGDIPAFFVTVHQVDVSNNGLDSSGGMAHALDCHEPSGYWVFSENQIHDNYGGGITARGQYPTISGNVFKNNVDSDIDVQTYASSGVVGTVSGTKVINNTLDGGAKGIRIGSTETSGGTLVSTYDNVTVSGNTITNTVEDGVYLINANKVTLVGNNIVGTTGRGIYSDNIDDFSVVGGTISIPGSVAITTWNGNYESIVGVNYRDTAGLSLHGAVQNLSGNMTPTGVTTTALSSNSDVSITSPAVKQYLRHDGTNWKNSALLLADFPTTGTWPTLTGALNFTLTATSTPMTWTTGTSGAYPGYMRIDNTGFSILGNRSGSSQFGESGHSGEAWLYEMPLSIAGISDSTARGINTFRKRTTGAILSGDNLFDNQSYGYDGAAYVRGVYIRARASQDWTGTNRGTTYEVLTRTKDGGAENTRLFIDENGNTTFSGTVQGYQLKSVAASGTPPLVVPAYASGATVTGLSADLLDGQHGSYYAPINAPTITGHPTIEGVASTGATGTGKLVFDTSPVLTTPTINGPTYGSTTSTTVDAGAVTRATISSSGATSITVSNMTAGRYLSLKITSSGGGAISVSTMTPTWVSGMPATIAAGKTSWFICEGTASNAADCVAVKENY